MLDRDWVRIAPITSKADSASSERKSALNCPGQCPAAIAPKKMGSRFSPSRPITNIVKAISAVQPTIR